MRGPRLTTPERREMILRALSGESISLLAGEYGVSRQAVHKAMDQARRNPEEGLREAEAEVEFWQLVREKVS